MAKPGAEAVVPPVIGPGTVSAPTPGSQGAPRADGAPYWDPDATFLAETRKARGAGARFRGALQSVVRTFRSLGLGTLHVARDALLLGAGWMLGMAAPRAGSEIRAQRSTGRQAARQFDQQQAAKAVQAADSMGAAHDRLCDALALAVDSKAMTRDEADAVLRCANQHMKDLLKGMAPHVSAGRGRIGGAWMQRGDDFGGGTRHAYRGTASSREELRDEIAHLVRSAARPDAAASGAAGTAGTAEASAVAQLEAVRRIAEDFIAAGRGFRNEVSDAAGRVVVASQQMDSALLASGAKAWLNASSRRALWQGVGRHFSNVYAEASAPGALERSTLRRLDDDEPDGPPPAVVADDVSERTPSGQSDDGSGASGASDTSGASGASGASGTDSAPNTRAEPPVAGAARAAPAQPDRQ